MSQETKKDVLELVLPQTIPTLASLPKAIDGYRIVKLSQYPERTVHNPKTNQEEIKPRSSWLYTTAFTTFVNYDGLKLSVNKWTRGAKADAPSANVEEISLWIDGTDAELSKLVEDEKFYLYYHESETEKPLTIEEYKSRVLHQKKTIDVVDTSTGEILDTINPV